MSRGAPLVAITSIRARLAVLVGVSVLVAAVVGAVGTEAGVPLWLGVPATVAVALVVTRWLAAGMTTPLLEMTGAADRMARGDYGVRITTSGRDEVGTLARAFSTMARDLEEAEGHRRRLVATVAHELRTPLSAQQALLENLVDGVVAPDDAALRNALAQSERLGMLVSDLLDLSRTDGRGAPFAPARVEVKELLDEASREAALQEREVTILVDVQPVDLTVDGDAGRLAQVTANLLDNALRHSPTGGTVTMRARTDDEHWWLTVADEGPGLGPERAERLFHRFGPGGDEGGGTGLGLAIAGWVAAMHCGTIRALAPDDAGARLRMSLPVRQVEPSSPSSVPLGPPDDEAPSRERPPTSRPLSAASPVVVGSPSPAVARWWPERTREARPGLLLTALGVGAAAALLLPEHPIGLGLLIVLGLGGGAIWAASPRRNSRWSWTTAVLALPLASTTVLREDPGFTFLAVVTTGVLAATACTDARSVTGMCAGVIAWPASALRGLPLLDRTVRVIARRGGVWSLARATAVSLVLLLVFGGLLASADAILGSWAARIVPEISDSFVFRAFTLVFFAGITLAGLYLAINPPKVEGLRASALTEARIPVREWQVPMVVVMGVIAAFLVAQGTALVGGHDYVLRTTGVTYAEYARQGFGQLTVATALVLLFIAGVRAWGRVSSPGDRRAMATMSALLCGLTLLVVASALRRMALYQDAFGYTIARVSADLIEIWLGIIVVAVLVSLFTSSRRWLGRAVLVSAAALMVLWSVGNTSAFVAQQNIERYESTGKLDEGYLARLPDDAIPAIHDSSLPQETRACVITADGQDSRADELPGWNLARERAAHIRAQYTRPEDCASVR